MDYYVILTFSLFSIVPTIIAWARLSNINPIYYPFLISVWLNAVNNVFGGIVVEYGYYNTFHYNIWILLDAFVLLWSFKKWGFFDGGKKLYYLLSALFGVVWISETIFITKLTIDYNSYFRILYSFVIILISINTVNYLIIRERKTLLKNSMFIICCALILFNTIHVLAEAFFAANLQLGYRFRYNMEFMIVVTSLLCNITYSLAILWMPKKQAFTLQY